MSIADRFPQLAHRAKLAKVLEGPAPPHPSNTSLETSKEAAESMADVTGHLRLRIFAFVAARGAYGATCDEVELELGMKHQTASARVHELMKSRHLVDTQKKRLTRGNRNATVWVAAFV